MKPLLNTTLLFFLLVIGCEQDASDFEETKRLAEQGDARAQYNLGFNYATGEGVPENDAEAVRWFRLAAEQGLAEAQSNLGTMYGYGRGVPENDAFQDRQIIIQLRRLTSRLTESTHLS
tara:strand:- start:175 stop:531 length:357 start_codon:yes stop_codon:yes gene_type:complete